MLTKQELIVYVDELGNPTGETAPKLKAHNSKTKLHLAFSCYIFNSQNQVLITRRAPTKKVWPGVLTNSVCGHPMPGESVEDAIRRRAKYELGLTDLAELSVILKDYTYKTPLFKGVIENEFCPVYFAKTDQKPIINQSEVADYEFIPIGQFISRTQNDKTDEWSYWCKDQVDKIMSSLENRTT